MAAKFGTLGHIIGQLFAVNIIVCNIKTHCILAMSFAEAIATARDREKPKNIVNVTTAIRVAECSE